MPAPAGISFPGYRLVRQLSQGGQGVVFLAVQESTGRKVAIKVLKSGPFATAADRTRFDREARVLAALDHPAIVPILDRGVTSGGWFFLVMDYVTGRALDEHFPAMNDPGQPRDVPAMLRLFVRLCDGVNAAHLRGVVHRDLKPSNVRIDDRGEPHVLDFGLAHTAFDAVEEGAAAGLVTQTGQFLGSLPWSSPEQVEGRTSAVDQRTDVYALGVMLYQMLTGSFPYSVVGTPHEVMTRILSATPPPPSRQGSTARSPSTGPKAASWRSSAGIGGLDATLDEIVLRALAKDQAQRYSTAGDLSRELTDHLGGQSPRRNQSRRKLLIGAAAAAIAGGGVAIVAMNWGRGPVADGRPTVPPANPRQNPVSVTAPATTTATAPADPLARRPGEPPIDWNRPLYDFIDRTTNATMSRSTGRTLYGDITRLLDDPRSSGEWLVGAGLTQTGQPYQVTISDGAFTTKALSEVQAAGEGLTRMAMRRSTTDEPPIWTYNLLTLGDAKLELVGQTTRRHVRGPVTVTIARPQRVFDVMFVLTTGTEKDFVQSYFHPEITELPQGELELQFDPPRQMDLTGTATLTAQAFLLHPRPGSYRISNGLPVFVKLNAAGPTNRPLKEGGLSHSDSPITDSTVSAATPGR